jgi:PAS domain S-box-containing protein
MASKINLPRKKRKSGADDQAFCLMFERHSAVMLIIEPQTGNILDANQAAIAFYGYPKPTLCGMTIDEINTLPPEQIAAERQRAIKEERNYFIFSHRLANGEERSVEVHSSPSSFREKQVLFSIIHDVTKRKQVEDALKLRESYLTAIIENQPGLVSLKDIHGRFLVVNSAFTLSCKKKMAEEVVSKRHSSKKATTCRRSGP